MKDWHGWPIRSIMAEDLSFPKYLREIGSCPKRLYYRGCWDEEIWKSAVAVVGSRRMTKYGRVVTEKIVTEMVGNGVAIVSGFMYGIDSEAHRVCIELGGRTVAVFGGGLDYLQVAENDDLYSAILNSGGLVISEYEPDFRPMLWSFPHRNRIVAGLSNLGVVIVEAGLKSGSLITADMARKQKRNVWAVPGPINSPVSAGCNWLIGEGRAKILTSPAEILGQRGEEQQSLDLKTTDPEEKKIIDQLSLEPLTIDELARKIGQGVVWTSAKVSLMQIEGRAEEDGGKIYLR